MKAILEFDLNEQDEAVAHLRCVRNWELAWALHSVMEKIRSVVDGCEREDGMIDGAALMGDCFEIIQDNHLSLDEMML